MRVLRAATAVALAILALDLAVQPIWTDDAWSIWAIKAASIVELGGLDPEFLSSAAVFNADYPLVVPVLELVAMRFAGWPTELVPLQLGLVFLAFPAALVALLRDRVRPLLLWTVVIAVALAPTLQVQTASTVADMTLAAFFALAGAAGWRWVETGEREYLWLAGVFAAAAAGSKAEGLVFVALLFAALAIASRRRAAVLVGAGALLTLLPWELWARRHDLGNAIADAGGTDLGPVDRLPSAGFDLAKELADPSSWLALVALGCAAVVLAFVRRERRAATFTAAVALGCLAAVLAAYWATPLDFDYHVATSVRRVITAPALFVAAMTPLLLSRVAVDRERPLGHPRDRELAAGAGQPRVAEPPRELGVAQQPVERRGKGSRVAGLDEEAGLAVGDHLRHGADARGDDRQAGEHRLEQHDPEALPARGVDEDVRPLEPVPDLEPAGQRRPQSPSPSDPDLRPELRLERAAAEDREPCVRMPLADGRERAPAASRGPSARSGGRRPAGAARRRGIPAAPGVGSEGAGGSSSRP